MVSPDDAPDTPTPLPLAGAVLERLERRGAWLVAVLCGAAAGRVQLLFFHGEAHGTVAALPLVLASGRLESADGLLGASIPCPWERPGGIELHAEGAEGEQLCIVGQALTVRAAETAAVPLVTLGRSAGVR
ncbi:MAG TPA: hypothetical protein DD490_17280 [Acidobacteria bacterium]|nr:hypothetical protein [Acidobacteriota bacterium]